MSSVVRESASIQTSSDCDRSIPGLLWVGGGSGANNPAFISDYVCAFGDRAYQYDTSILWDFVNVNPFVDGATDACIVFLNAFATEGWDRTGMIVLNMAESKLTFLQAFMTI